MYMYMYMYTCARIYMELDMCLHVLATECLLLLTSGTLQHTASGHPRLHPVFLRFRRFGA